MKNCSFLLLCILAACSVWTVRGRRMQIDDEEELDELFGALREFPNTSAQLPGMCWGCKWALGKLKKVIGPNTSAETIKSKLRAVCDQMGLLKSKCHKFVNSHLGVLVEELTTTDSVKTICIKAKACRSREQSELIFYPNKEESRHIVISEMP